MLISKNRPSHTGKDLLLALLGTTPIADFENAFATYVGATHAIAFPYCRMAIRIALEELTPPGSTVVLPAYTCVVVAHAIVLAGRLPRFVDVEHATFNATPAGILHEVNEQVGAIIPTHMYGTPMDVMSLEQGLTQPLLLLEDGALGLLPAFRPTQASVSAATVYSFGSNKHLSTIRGGMLVTHDATIAERIRTARDRALRHGGSVQRLRHFAELSAFEVFFSPFFYGIIDILRSSSLLASHLDTRSIDYPSFPPSAAIAFTRDQAALGLEQLTHAKEFLRRRREIARLYDEALAGRPFVEPMSPPKESHVSHYALRIHESNTRRISQQLRAHGVETGQTFTYSVPELPPYKKYAHREFPVAHSLAREVINLPNYPLLSNRHVHHIIRAVEHVMQMSEEEI